MRNYIKIKRFLLVFFAVCAGGFAAVQEYEAAMAMALLWLLSKASLAVADVFYTFFTERPLFSAEKSFSVEGSSRNFSAR